MILNKEETNKKIISTTDIKEYELREMDIKEVFGLYENRNFVDIAYIKTKKQHLELVEKLKAGNVYVKCKYNNLVESWEILL